MKQGRGLCGRFHATPCKPVRESRLRFEDVDIGMISKPPGHVSITTTARYLDHIAPMAVVEVMRSRAWTAS